LANCREAFDLIISADTLVYFGALEAVFNTAFRALRPDGLLIFTVEGVGEDQPETGYRINPHGRYSHSRAYVERALTAAGFATPAVVEAALRMEAGDPVAGLVITARKGAGIGILAAGGI
jgi:predicted TPR repeat methyltransferase